MYRVVHLHKLWLMRGVYHPLLPGVLVKQQNGVPAQAVVGERCLSRPLRPGVLIKEQNGVPAQAVVDER